MRDSIAQATAAVFVLAYCPPRPGSGHKVFLAGDKVVLADWSGTTPDRTDDGPLYVDPSRKAMVTLSSAQVCVDVPVVNLVGSRLWTRTNVETTEVIRRFVALPLERSQPLQQVIADALRLLDLFN